MSPLRHRMIEDMQIRNLAPHTQRAYVQQISQFARHFRKSPELLGPADIRAYQIHLTQDRQLSASSILVAVAAIRFLYKITLNGIGTSRRSFPPAASHSGFPWY
jgi:integrase/recombinase XerD